VLDESHALVLGHDHGPRTHEGERCREHTEHGETRGAGSKDAHVVQDSGAAERPTIVPDTGTPGNTTPGDLAHGPRRWYHPAVRPTRLISREERMEKMVILGLLIFGLALGARVTAGPEALKDPAKLNAEAPATYSVKFETSEGSFVISVTREWSPLGADRFYNLVKNGFYDDLRVFRVVPGFVVQFGMSGDPALSKVWQTARIKDDPVKGSNKKGHVTFAMAGPNSRTTQVFINLKDNTRLDGMGFSPIGVVTEGMDVVEKLYGGYGDDKGPNQGRIASEGNAYLDKDFPDLDRLTKATIVTP
jgi:peptidyl-prolyl cis-trans isomerase A (cyclophilin A)